MLWIYGPKEISWIILVILKKAQIKITRKKGKRLEGANIFGQVNNPYEPETRINKNDEMMKRRIMYK